MSLGMGFAFVALSSTALIGVDDRDAGVASALVNTTQQVGGSLGTALLNTIAASATVNYIASHGAGSAPRGAVHGYTVAFTWGLGALILAAVLSLGARHEAARPGGQPRRRDPETVFEHAEELQASFSFPSTQTYPVLGTADDPAEQPRSQPVKATAGAIQSDPRVLRGIDANPDHGTRSEVTEMPAALDRIDL